MVEAQPGRVCLIPVAYMVEAQPGRVCLIPVAAQPGRVCLIPVAYGRSTAWSCVLDPSSLW